MTRLALYASVAAVAFAFALAIFAPTLFAYLFSVAIALAGPVIAAVFAGAGLYVGAKWAYELFTGWRTHVAPTRQAHAARLVDAEAEGWLETIEWPFPRPTNTEGHTEANTGEIAIPRVGVA